MIYVFHKIIQKLKNAFTKPVSVRERFGENLVIGKDSILREGSRCYFNPKFNRTNRKCIQIGTKSLIQAGFTFEDEGGKVTIGDNVYIGDANFISRCGITVGNNVTMAWGIYIYDHDAHSVIWEERKYDNERCYHDYIHHDQNLNYSKDWSVVKTKEIIIENNVWIGFDSLILKGVTIGEGAVVAAKSVVTKDVPSYTLVAGNPAQIIKALK